MVRLTSPLHSQAATGKLGDTLTLQLRGHQHTLGRTPKPRQPNSETQRAQKSLISAITRTWKLHKAAWEPLWRAAQADPTLSPYHNYLAAITRQLAHDAWPNFCADQPPGHAPPVFWESEKAIFPRALQLRLRLYYPFYGALYALRLSTDPAPLDSPDDVWRYEPAIDHNWHTIEWRDLPTGWHYAQINCIDQWGQTCGRQPLGYIEIPD
jgi:hypothetical protein